jgi:hypothetical protein
MLSIVDGRTPSPSAVRPNSPRVYSVTYEIGNESRYR